MRTLLHKELRSLRPFLALVLFFASLNWVFMLLAEYPDQYPLSKLFSDENRTNTQVVTFLIAFALSAGLLVREQDEGTLAFLDALPVSRGRVFFCKVLIALAVLWLLPLGDFAFNATFHALSRTSLETRFHWDILVTALGLDLVACVIYFFLGLALSFLRRFSLLVLGVLVWTYVLLREINVPFIPLLNIFTLGDLVFQGQNWLIPWPKLAVQLVMAVACGGVAFVAFQFSGDRAQRLAGRVKSKWGGTVLTGVTTVLVLGVWIGFVIYIGEKSGAGEGQKVTYADWSTARASTAQYQFLYPDNRGEALQPLLNGADAVEAKVRAFLEAAPQGPIVVDLTTAQPRHAGLAYWRKVRMNLPHDATGDRGAQLLAVLGHETTHLYIDQLSGGRLSDNFDSTRFFHEGLASFVEHHLFAPGKLASQRRVAAVMRARDEVKMEELFDDEKLRLRRDPDLVYPLGEAFVAALVQRYGSNAPSRVLKAFGRENAPKGLAGFALWQDTFQACGFNLSDVTEAYFALLDREVVEHRRWIDALPRLRGAVEQTSDVLRVRATFEGTAPGTMICRFRPRADTEDRFYEATYDSSGDSRFQVDAVTYPERSFWYQLGWMPGGASQPIFEPWVEVRRTR